MSDLRPAHGVRYLLERATDEGARATYRATIFLPDREHQTTAVLGDDGSVELAPSDAPAELADTLAMIAKLTARGAAKRRDDGLPAWPARILRWRGPGRGG